MKAIYEYLDYREFLKDDLRSRQARNPRYSMRAMADKLEISPTVLTRILKGERNISRKMMPKFMDYLRPRNKESEYFKALVRFNQSKDQGEKRLFYDRIKSFRKLRLKKISPDSYQYFEHWYHVAIRELLHIAPVGEDYNTLAKRLQPAISASQAQKAIGLLEALGLIQRRGLRWVLTDRVMVTDDKWKNTDIHSFQRTMAGLGQEALDRFSKTERDISTFTMSLSEAAFQKVKNILAEARQKIVETVEEDEGMNRVYEMNMQLFPLSEPIRVKNEN